MDKRIKRLEGQVLWRRPPSAEVLEAARKAHQAAIEGLEKRCEEGEDPTNCRAALEDLKQHLRERGRY